MTGVGFGGCTVTITAEAQVKELKAWVAEEYPAKTGLLQSLRLYSFRWS